MAFEGNKSDLELNNISNYGSLNQGDSTAE